LRFADTFATGTSPEGVAVADLNRDGIPDLAVGTNGTISVHLGTGAGDLRRARRLRDRKRDSGRWRSAM
jgi:hypothetical protein